ncbi:LysM peptidoglycan-binding domain-containing protein [Roseibium aggregatum]|uniref:LysM peptidoglycan-binding domain-containing protein n=1 Tax=Roseibium aggregatum TaxID=187304 RepID=A0A939J145_9HYPH|nr:LysM peptidoglycan-binding domain-containing protein [Roseibium aggregatum]MBN9669958.1 LysM peptidoglycan-binding domain-containing protein [Roseibium aggregatum]
MNKKTLIWTMVVAVPVAVAALVTGYVYRDTGSQPSRDVAETGTAQDASPAKAPEQTASTGNAGNTAGETASEEQVAAGDEPDAKTAEATSLKGPSFDVVGVEPTGETVVAGRSKAGAIVALTANGDVVGKSIANQAGEWTIILDEPLKPGDYDVGLEVHDESGSSIEQSEQRLAVSVPEDGKQQPLVVLNSPDGPSNVLQKPEESTQVASASAPEGADTATAPETSSGDKAPEGQSTQVAQLDETAGNETTASGSASAHGTADSTSSGEAGETRIAALTEEETPADADADALAAGEGSAAAGAAAGSDEKPASDNAGTAEALSTEAPQGTNGRETAAAPGTENASGAEPAPSVTVEAVESEPDKVYVAGTGTPGTSVRVYVGDDFQGEAKVNASGKWLVQGTKTVSEGNVEVRADQIGEDGNTVDARAAVTFEKARDKQVVLTKVVATGTGTGKDAQGAEVKKSLPVVIIRKGDNLWRISRRLYGDGVRYTTIYQANQDQIRNPDLIYPGQVFLTPEGDLNWKPQANEPG